MVCLLRNPMVKWKNWKLPKSKFYDIKRIENIDGTWKNAIWGILMTQKSIFWTFFLSLSYTMDWNHKVK